MKPQASEKTVERVQTGVRIEKRILKVAKGLAEYLDMSLGDLLEGVLLNAFEGKDAFSSATLERIGMLKDLYGLKLIAADAHQLRDDDDRVPPA
ncbi:hypothetical protein [Xanthobacter sediminis]|uniref:hypothetical protein n=1 Tax=Xanthobacter sediminis TaxID=3119926 RepID=UPI003726E838